MKRNKDECACGVNVCACMCVCMCVRVCVRVHWCVCMYKLMFMCFYECVWPKAGRLLIHHNVSIDVGYFIFTELPAQCQSNKFSQHDEFQSDYIYLNICVSSIYLNICASSLKINSALFSNIWYQLWIHITSQWLYDGHLLRFRFYW